jgi:DNA topoisomerase-1
VKGADKLILATDPDREGEAISWHILEVLNQEEGAEGQAGRARGLQRHHQAGDHWRRCSNPREIDEPLVDAYLARRALDYLVGFTLSPVLWRKLPGSRSAGRVQSVALRLICDREAEIERFRTEEYWTSRRTLSAKGPRAGASGAPGIHRRQEARKARHQGRGGARRSRPPSKAGSFKVASVEKKPAKRNPYAAVHHLDLQQDASRKLGFSAKQTMQVAQRLYEGVDIGGETVGLITYMRTDGVTSRPRRSRHPRAIEKSSASATCRRPAHLQEQGQERAGSARGDPPDRPVRNPGRSRKRARCRPGRPLRADLEAHDRQPDGAAEIERRPPTSTSEGRDGKPYGLRATGSVITFDGFLAVYEEGRDDRRDIEKGKDDGEDDEDDAAACRRSPPATRLGTSASRRPALHPAAAALHRSHARQAHGRARHRPALDLRLDLGGAAGPRLRADRQEALVPEDKGRLVTAFLESFFKRYVEYDFTADLEEKLDLISDGKLEWKDVLRDFWKRLHRRRRRDQGSARHRRARRAERAARPAHLPGQGRRLRSRACPKCGDLRPASCAEDRQVRRLHRLLELSRVPLHAPARPA